MKNVLRLIVALALALVAGLVQAGTVEHRVKSRENLGKIGAQYGVAAANICAANDIVDCDIIWPGQRLMIPTGSAVSAKPTVKKSAQPTKRVVEVSAKTQVSGPLPINALNVAPYRLSRTLQLDRNVLKSRGFTDAEVDEFHALEQSGKCELQAFSQGAPMLWMVGTYGKVTTSPLGLVANWKSFHSARVCELASGKRIAIFQICENLAGLPRVPKAPEPPPLVTQEVPTPVVVETPQPPEKVVEVPPLIVPSDDTATLCGAYRKHANAGFEIDWNKHGGTSRAAYAQVAVLCTVYEDYNGSHSIGPVATGSIWGGSTGQGGDFEGHFAAGGFAYEYVAIQDKYDFMVGFPLFGVLHDEFRQDRYENERHFKPVLALSANLNSYPRKARGEDWWYETQVSIVAARTLGSRLLERWDGRDLADSSGLNMLWYVNATVREYAYRKYLSDELGNAEFYLQLGGLKADRLSGNARVGMALMRRCVGAGAGVNFSADGVNPAVGGWTDPLQCGVFYRNYERGKYVRELGAAVGVSFNQDDLVPIKEEEVNTPATPQSTPTL